MDIELNLEIEDALNDEVMEPAAVVVEKKVAKP
jgi:hypothetical protein